MAAKNLLITGRPRVGKTTLIQRITHRLDELAGGFTTGEILENGRRIGFSITSLDGKKGILAREGLQSPYGLGRYGVDVEEMDRVGTQALLRTMAKLDKKWIIVDEIGKMEEYSKAFKKAMIDALDCPKHVIATIRLHDSIYTAAIKAREDVEVIRLTAPERDSVYRYITENYLVL